MKYEKLEMHCRFLTTQIRTMIKANENSPLSQHTKFTAKQGKKFATLMISHHSATTGDVILITGTPEECYNCACRYIVSSI